MVTSYTLALIAFTDVGVAVVPVTVKSLMSTFATASLKVTRNTRVSAFVTAEVGDWRLKDVIPGAVLSSVYVSSIDGSIFGNGFEPRSAILCPEFRFNPIVPLRLGRFPPEIVTSYTLALTALTDVGVAVVPVATKSLISTFVTASLKVARNVRVSAFVVAEVGDWRAKDVMLGAVLSSVYVSSVGGSVSGKEFEPRSAMLCPRFRFNPTIPLRLGRSPPEIVTSYTLALTTFTDVGVAVVRRTKITSVNTCHCFTESDTECDDISIGYR